MDAKTMSLPPESPPDSPAESPPESPAQAPAEAAGEATGAGRERKKKPRREKKPPRPLLVRLFGLKFFGYLKLVLTCVLVGLVMLAIRFNPADPGFDATQAIGDLWTNTVAAAGWTMHNLWKPALAGASVVLPVWVLWRLLTLPFRR